jgi:hypothetical protein
MDSVSRGRGRQRHACAPRLTLGAAHDSRLRSARIATRQEKLAASDLAFTKLASIRIWLRA